MLLFLAIILLIILILICIGIVIWLLIQRSRSNTKIFIRDGVDVDSGLLGTGPEDFSRKQYQTRLLSREERDEGTYGWQVTFYNQTSNVSFTVSFINELMLGRGKEGQYQDKVCGISQDQSVSRHQARLLSSAGSLWIQNAGEKVMLKCDGKNTGKPVMMKPGSVLRVGRVKIQVVRAARIQARKK